VLPPFLALGCAEPDSTRNMVDGSTTVAEPSSGSSGPIDDEPPRADLGVEPPQTCEASCEVVSGCRGIASSDCLLRCTAELEAARDHGEECRSRHEALESCLATLSCEDLADHDAGADSPCRESQQRSAVSFEPASTTCTDFCSAAAACGVAETSACEAACVQTRASATETGASCAAAQDELFACVAVLDCATLEAWMSSRDTSACPEDLDRACSGDQE